jgi:hypothetical protein
MPLLAYCILEAGRTIEVPAKGVQNALILSVSECGLTGVLSEYQPRGDRTHIRAEALDFNRVLQQFLQHVALVPFRFPTLVADESEMSVFLKEHTHEYRELLLRLRDVVQMELNLAIDQPLPASQESGTEYLRARQNQHHILVDSAGAARLALKTWIQDWHQHESSSGMRCYMLVPRTAVTTVLQQLKGTNIASGLHARVTGPWPATEFLSANRDS